MFTLARLVEVLGMRTWQVDGVGQPERTLYYTPPWVAAFNALPGPTGAKRLTRDISIRGRVDGLATRFAAGDTWDRLLTPRGDGSEPIFLRMRTPNACVVEMRTFDTRTFGFFSGRNVFVACSIELKTSLKKAGNSGYLRHAGDVQKLLAHLSPSEYDCTTDVRSLIAD